MYQYRLYNFEEIEKLNRDLEVYKKAIETWNESESVLYMEAQEDLEATKKELAKYKGDMKVMEETYQKQIQGYEQKEQKIAAQIHAINHSIQQLKKDVHSIKDDVKEIRINELLEKVDQIIGNTDTELHEVKKQINEQKNTITQVKNQPHPNKQQRTKRRTSEYRQLHNMLKAAKPKSHVTPPPSNSSMTNPKPRRQPANTNMITIQNGKKTFHNAKYELNKNIIVKKKKANVEQKNTRKVTKAKEGVKEEIKEKIQEETDNKSMPENEVKEKDIQQVKQVQESQPQKPTVTPEPKELNSVVTPEPKKQELTVEPEPKTAMEKQEQKTTQEESSSPSGIKKTWLLAKSLWKK
ncbi:hypothetical protein GI584_14775 [Gracilibacillus salitolerans]|uniref:Uncharacterized protein n=1 Tax=Gracilibacillus salitolerans TaxID=2663022 RepID=A0A5Q2TJX4_9BACI|nr:hypothetical protein [Gracilibacillus salitolerans]QGH35234.1 hypothetical protein GI584_14775 [Gracilibacillus salitolerans]